MKETGFVFLFDKFKSSYLQWLLPDFDRNSSVYSPDLGNCLYYWSYCEITFIRRVPIFVGWLIHEVKDPMNNET